jgi:hypothetical protein
MLNMTDAADGFSLPPAYPLFISLMQSTSYLRWHASCDTTRISTVAGGKTGNDTREVVKMAAKQHFTTEQALEIGNKLGIDWSRFNPDQFRAGLDVELEHGLKDPLTDVTKNDPIITGKIALAHLNEYADYYTRLKKMEKEAEEQRVL